MMLLLKGLKRELKGISLRSIWELKYTMYIEEAGDSEEISSLNISSTNS